MYNIIECDGIPRVWNPAFFTVFPWHLTISSFYSMCKVAFRSRGGYSFKDTPSEKKNLRITDRLPPKQCFNKHLIYIFVFILYLQKHSDGGAASFLSPPSCTSTAWTSCFVDRRPILFVQQFRCSYHLRLRVINLYPWPTPRICETAKHGPAKGCRQLVLNDVLP